MQRGNLNNHINIVIRKVTSNKLTAAVQSSDFNEKVKEFIASDQSFTFMSSIKGTQPNGKNDILAMVKKLGVQTFFMTL